MNEKVKQIFEILGVEPEEEFKINSLSVLYKFNVDLKLVFTDNNADWRISSLSIGDIISYGIIKTPQKPKLSNKDKVAIKFLKNCGFHYLVKSDIKDLLNALENMPDKVTVDDERIVWVMNGDNYYFPTNAFDMPISHKEPLCLDDFTDENLKED